MHGINNCLHGLALGSSMLSVKVCTSRGLNGISQGLRVKSDRGWCTLFVYYTLLFCVSAWYCGG
jgi:hypothetical protein